jgi:drug/metabolite transporter (DMT)-like permease
MRALRCDSWGMVTHRTQATGWLNGLIGVVIFSASLPATRIAVLSLTPLFVSFARAAIAGILAASFLLIARQRPPARTDLGGLGLVALGAVLGFPLLSALALRHMTSAHALLFIALLPLSTASFAVLLAKERPKSTFWVFAAAGAALVAAYAMSRDRGSNSLLGDALMLAAIIVCGLGYAEGGRLSRRLGGWQVISWALVISLPFMLPLAIWQAPDTWQSIGWPAWVGLAYVSVFSMLIGFVFWYRGLAQGGIAAVGQLQLLQPFFGLGLAALLLREPVSGGLVSTSLGVVFCVAGAKRFAA